MFRFNWPTSELLFGQYWSMFCEYYAESAEDGPLQMTGTPTARLAQIRFTQKFMSDCTVAALIGDPNQATLPFTGTTGPLIMPDQQRPVGGNPAGPGENPIRPRLLG